MLVEGSVLIYIYIYEDNLVQESTDDLIEDNIDEGWEIK